MAMYSFVPPFREAKFCGVASCVFDKLGCAAGDRRLRNNVLDDRPVSLVVKPAVVGTVLFIIFCF
jgi:hypothetical protein